jgi:cyclopropane fatty-acyl-phospholipid synthase-like methyltransferase
MSEQKFSAADVASYYDRSTPAFVALGQGGSEGAIRRAVWGPGTRDRTAAFHYVDDRIAEVVRAARSTEEPHVVDLGCGVGATLCYLARGLPIRGTGITVSPLQAELAQRRAREAGLAARVTFVEGDFMQLPGVPPADVAVAIESFVHAPSAEVFFAQCRELVRPGGALVICDDFRRPTADRRASAALAQFRRGWHINSLLDASELHTLARAAGFTHESTTDLTAYLELNRPRDRAVNVFLALFGWLPLQRTPLGHLVGGSALQRCLSRGWIGYDLAVFRRS